MPDRSVYLVEKVTAAMIKDERYVFVDDATLGSALAEGWEISTTMHDRKLTIDGERVVADMIILKQAAENRGVSVAEPRAVRETASERSGGQSVTVMDDFGMPRSMSLPQAMVEALQNLSRGLTNMGEHTGHLGAPGQHNIPGLSIISGKTVSQAYDVGMLAGARGESKEANPFPPGSVPSTKWLQGFADSSKVAKQKITQATIDEAEKMGYDLAVQLGKGDDEVHCPHSHPTLKAAWISGFKRGGGDVK
jgi:ribosome modulation factor